MSRPDRRWRPSDADRERYAGAISQAFAEGRIDAAEMESRTASVYEATSIADLDALVEDMPAPAAPSPEVPATRSSGIGVGWVIGAVAVVLVVMFAVLSTITSGVDSPEPEAPPPAVAAPVPEPLEPPEPPAPDLAGLPDIATEKAGLFTTEGLDELWAAMPEAGYTQLFDIALFAERARIDASAGTSRPAIATVEYEGGLVLPADLVRDAGPSDLPFTWGDVTPAAVLAAHDGTLAMTDQAGVTVRHISIDNDFDGQVTIRVYPEGDIGFTYARFDASGQLIRTY